MRQLYIADTDRRHGSLDVSGAPVGDHERLPQLDSILKSSYKFPTKTVISTSRYDQLYCIVLY